MEWIADGTGRVGSRRIELVTGEGVLLNRYSENWVLYSGQWATAAVGQKRSFNNSAQSGRWRPKCMPLRYIRVVPLFTEI